MKAVTTEAHRSHDPQFLVVRGTVRRTTEQPERADRLLAGFAVERHTPVDAQSFAPGALVVALGLDASEEDPLAGMAVTTPGFERIGAALSRLGLPTVFAQEGGHPSDILGRNLTAVLGGCEAAH